MIGSNTVSWLRKSRKLRDQRGVAHRRLADEDRVGTSIPEAPGVLGRLHTALCDEGGPREPAGELLGNGEVYGEVPKVAVVDPDDLSAGLEREIRLPFVVHLDERGEAELDGQRDVSGERSHLEEGGDE
jgi:hypothetical protein